MSRKRPACAPNPSGGGKRVVRGFTLIEILVIMAIVAIGIAGASLGLRDSRDTLLEREAQRLAALLDAARAQSRATGIAVRWRAADGGFAFDGIDPRKDMPTHWLDPQTYVATQPNAVTLGPEPIIAPQSIALGNTQLQQSRFWVLSDGIRPFRVSPVQP